MKRDANIEAYRLLRRFVPEFRDFVRGQLVGRYGAERWLDRVPEDVRQRLSEFEKKWRENPWVGTCAESPLDFSYEEDLIRIVTEEDNWRNVFRKWFGSDKRVIETKLKEIRWLRDHVAHFRALDRDQEAKLRALCKDVMLCIARAAKVQADRDAPEGLLSPDDLLSGKEVAELIAEMVRAAKPGQPGKPSAIEGGRAQEIQSDVEKFLLEREFDLGAAPDESDVKPTKVHQWWDDWELSPAHEVLMWQTYAPREPVVRGSKVRLAIRYNPVAVNAPGAERQGVGRRRRRGGCAVSPTTDIQMVRACLGTSDYPADLAPRETRVLGRVAVEPEGWAFLEYVPPWQGLYSVFWFAGRGPDIVELPDMVKEPIPYVWALDAFWVE